MAGEPINPASLHGSWDLISWRQTEADGRVFHPFTDQVRGQLIYAPDGRLAVFLMRPGWAAGETADGFVAYGGRFLVDGGDIHHLVAFASQKALVNSNQVRAAHLDGDSLALEAPSHVLIGSRHCLEWRRVSPARQAH